MPRDLLPVLTSDSLIEGLDPDTGNSIREHPCFVGVLIITFCRYFTSSSKVHWYYTLLVLASE